MAGYGERFDEPNVSKMFKKNLYVISRYVYRKYTAKIYTCFVCWN